MMGAKTDIPPDPAMGRAEVVITERVIIDRFDVHVFPDEEGAPDGGHPVIYAFRSIGEHLSGRPASAAAGTTIEFAYDGVTYAVSTGLTDPPR